MANFPLAELILVHEPDQLLLGELLGVVPEEEILDGQGAGAGRVEHYEGHILGRESNFREKF